MGVTNYSNYIRLKSKLRGRQYRGYPLDQVLGSYIATLVWKPSTKVWIKFLLINTNTLRLPVSSELLLTYTTERSDYRDLMSGYFPKVRPHNVAIQFSLWASLRDVIISFYYFFKSLLFLRHIGGGVKDRLILATVMSVGFKIINKLERNDFKCRQYVAFNSSYLVESFVSWYFRKRGIETFSIQHAMYYSYAGDPPFDVINFENVCAESLLTWGEFSKNEISEYLPETSSSVLYGVPLSRFPRVVAPTFSQKILVVLPRDLFLTSVFNLLHYLSSYDYEYLIRPHPSITEAVHPIILSNEGFELDSNRLLTHTLGQYRFRGVIGFNSSAIFEAALYGQSTYVFDAPDNEIRRHPFPTFSTESDLSGILQIQGVVAVESMFATASATLFK